MGKCKYTESVYDNMIYFYDTGAYTDTGKFNKEKIVKELENLWISSKDKIAKKTNLNDVTTVYRFVMDGVSTNIIIPKKYAECNQEYINKFNDLIRKNKKAKLKNFKLIALASVASIATTIVAYEPVKNGLNIAIEKIDDLLTDEVGDLEDEILIHSGHGEIDGRTINPYNDHGCVFKEENTLSVPERIIAYCEEYDLEYLTTAALERYDYLLNDDMELADTIDLKELEKEHKEKQKSKNLQ